MDIDGTERVADSPEARDKERASHARLLVAHFLHNEARAIDRAIVDDDDCVFIAMDDVESLVDGLLLAASFAIQPTEREDEYMSVSIDRAGNVTSHNAYDANFDEMVDATRAIIAALQDRLNNRDKCPFMAGRELRQSTQPTERGAVCARCNGNRDDLAEGRDPEELCEPCYEDARTALATQPATPIPAEHLPMTDEIEGRLA